MKYFITSLLTSFIFYASFAKDKKVCFTFDDLPLAIAMHADSSYYISTFHKILNQLTENKIPAIGFVNEKNLYTNGSLITYRLELLKLWHKRGLMLGNHTYSHSSYHQSTLEEYGNDILRGERTIQNLLINKNGKKYFRHPYLHVGQTKEKADSLQTFLSKHNYTIAPVTIDNEDYIFSSAYQIALAYNEYDLADRIKWDYIKYMENKMKYFEELSIKLFGRNIPHILLLHNNPLNAEVLNELIDIYKKWDYDFISIDEALEDGVYNSPITVYKNWGISWVERWALSRKVPKEFFYNDPQTPSYIYEYIESLNK